MLNVGSSYVTEPRLNFKMDLKIRWKSQGETSRDLWTPQDLKLSVGKMYFKHLENLVRTSHIWSNPGLSWVSADPSWSENVPHPGQVFMGIKISLHVWSMIMESMKTIWKNRWTINVGSKPGPSPIQRSPGPESSSWSWRLYRGMFICAFLLLLNFHSFTVCGFFFTKTP